MLNNARKIVSLIILILGVALVIRTIATAESFSLSAGLVAGLSFIAYGAVRFFYLKDGS